MCYTLREREDDHMTFEKKCSLCGGKLDSHLRCTECGLDNTKNDDMYNGLLNRNKCDGEPMTHVHNDSERDFAVCEKHADIEKAKRELTKYTNTYSANTYTTKSRSSTQNKRTNPSKRIGRFIGIMVIITWILPTLFGFMASLINNRVIENWIEEEVSYGDTYEQYLDPGFYTVGVHIPEGTYDVEIVSGSYGDIEIYEYDGEDIMMKDFYFMDIDYEDQSYIDALCLEDGDILSVAPGMGISMLSCDAVTNELYTEANPVSETYVVSSSAVAGVDFPAGVYDVYYEPYEEEEFGNVSFSIWSEEKQRNMMEKDLYLDSYMGEVSFKNVPLTEESKIGLVDLKAVTLVPSDEVDPKLHSVSGESL